MTSHGLSRSDSESTRSRGRAARPPGSATACAAVTPGHDARPPPRRTARRRPPPPARRVAIANTPGSPEDTTATRRPRSARSRANSARSASTRLSLPCRRCRGLRRHPVQVGGVADEVVGGGQHAARLRGQPVAPGRAETDDVHPPGRRSAGAAVGPRATRRRRRRPGASGTGHDDQRHVRHRAGSTSPAALDALPRARRWRARRSAPRPAARSRFSARRTAANCGRAS